jgi:purine-binding chemotaxis protein CheW
MARPRKAPAPPPSRSRGGARRRPSSPPGAPAPSETPVSEWVSREEPLVFPSDPEPAAPGRLSLPSSGLAEEILARADAAALTRPAPSEAAPAPAPEPAPAAAGKAHNISFFAAPAREERRAAEATEHLVTFVLQREEYGVDVRLVQEIIRVTEITPVPRAPEAIRGVINLRGRIIPVVDLKRRLGLGETSVEAKTRIVVVKVRERLMGLLVDAASQVLKVPVSVIEAAPEEVVEIDANQIRGVAKLPGRLIILMDLNRVLGMEAKEGALLPPT